MNDAAATIDISPLLAGATLVITRPAATAATLKRQAQTLGGITLGLPGMSLRSMDDATVARVALKNAQRADIVIFISPVAVRYAFRLLPNLSFSRATRVCAIGAGTARALKRHGLHDVQWPDQQDSEGLLALPLLAQIHGFSIALIGAPGGRDVLPDTLYKRGADLHRADVYQRVAPRLSQLHFAALAQAQPPLLTLLSSAEVLSNLQVVLPPPLFGKLAAGEGVVSSLRLAHAARAAGFARVHVAASAGVADMLAAAVNALAHHRL